MVLAIIDALQGELKKAAMEAASYAYKCAQSLGTDANALVIGNVTPETCKQLGKNGIKQVWLANYTQAFDCQSIANIAVEKAKEKNALTIVMLHNSTGRQVAPQIAMALQASYVSAATNAIEQNIVAKNVYAGKAIAYNQMQNTVKVITVNPNALPLEALENEANVEEVQYNTSIAKTQVIDTQRVQGKTPLPEAELVVSAGRGLKGPENWGMIEECAELLGATTACSRAVSDLDWRPHHEHVGQTGLTIRPNLYIAVAISGAIQHLAGVNGSKTIVVINKDPEAPFFKAADYGIVGDAFEVVPKLNEAIRKYKQAQA